MPETSLNTLIKIKLIFKCHVIHFFYHPKEEFIFPGNKYFLNFTIIHSFYLY